MGKDKKRLPQIVLFGDSLTQYSFEETSGGFGYVIDEMYRGKADILDEGVAGYTTTMLIPTFRNIMQRATASGAPPTLFITIFLGANDAATLSSGPYVPLPKYEENLRLFVESILIEDRMESTKIVLITPPPINIRDALPDPFGGEGISDESMKKGRGYLTYMNKKLYAEKVMELAAEYEETGRVIGLNLWKDLIDAALKDQGRLGVEDAYHEDKLPGSGLNSAKEFKTGYFTDGLHLDALGYDVLTKGLLELTFKKWPELSPDTMET